MHRYWKWRDALFVAPDEPTVVAIVRDYVGTLDAGVIGLLPPECRESLGGHVDVQSAAVALLHSELGFRGNDELGRLLHEVAQTFAAASIRLSRLRTESMLLPPT